MNHFDELFHGCFPVACRWERWDPWSACDVKNGSDNGLKRRNRTIEQEAMFEGKNCNMSERFEEMECEVTSTIIITMEPTTTAIGDRIVTEASYENYS